MNNTSMDTIYRLSQAMVQVRDLNEALDSVLDEVVELLNVSKVSVMTYDSKNDVLKVIAARGLDPSVIEKALVRRGEGISGKVFASSEPILIEDIRTSSFDEKGKYKTRSLMSAPVTCFPMKVGDIPLGVINVTDRNDGKSFDEKDMELLKTISNQFAVYLHLVNLAIRDKEHERMREQLEIARQIQYRLLPLTPPKIDGLDIAGRLITAERVGGDYYDCFVHDERKSSFVVADVSGHSVGAGLVMAAFRAALKAQLDNVYSPSILMEHVNKILFQDLYQAEQFITVAYIQYQKSRQQIVCTVAGHPPILVWRNQEEKFVEITTDDPCLGIEPSPMFHEKSEILSKGDIVVLYTDGATEVANARGERFGMQRLKACIADSSEVSAKQISDIIVENVQSFSDPNPLKDDVTALVLKIV
ncbi:MAG: GAF domain-containing SpoIIE family protein phosphatase [Pseudomonadota bacterium]